LDTALSKSSTVISMSNIKLYLSTEISPVFSGSIKMKSLQAILIYSKPMSSSKLSTEKLSENKTAGISPLNSRFKSPNSMSVDSDSDEIIRSFA